VITHLPKICVLLFTVNFPNDLGFSLYQVRGEFMYKVVLAEVQCHEFSGSV